MDLAIVVVDRATGEIVSRDLSIVEVDGRLWFECPGQAIDDQPVDRAFLTSFLVPLIRPGLPRLITRLTTSSASNTSASEVDEGSSDKMS